MIRVLHFAHGLTSYNNSLVEMLSRFEQAGITATVACHVDLSDLLSSSSAGFVHLSENQVISDNYQVEIRKQPEIKRSAIAYVAARFGALQLQRRARYQSLHSCEIQSLIENYQPDLLLIDNECHFAVLASRRFKVPTVLCSRLFSLFQSPDLPPMHTSLMPADTLLQALSIKVAWGRLWCFKFWLSMRDRFTRRRFRPVRYETVSRFDLLQLAAHLGLDARQHTDWCHWQIPHVYKDLPVMSLTARELEFPQAIDKRMHYAGPMVGGSDQGNSKVAAGMALLAEFLSQAQRLDKPLVYCSLSTYWITTDDQLPRIIALFAKRQDLNLVVGLGGKSVPSDYAQVPDNVLLLEYAPQVEVLEQADVAISHGGISTINEALHAGAPLIICSSGHVDQNGCGARVVYHKVGLETRSKPLSTVELEGLIEQLLEGGDKNVVRQNVRELQAKLRHYDDSHAAVNTLLSFVND